MVEKENLLSLVHQQLTYKPKYINAVIQLLEEGNTVPFIARYRKEMTGAMDEVQIREIEMTYQQLTSLETRKQEVIAKIAEQGKLNDALRQKIEQATKVTAVEDLYRPYKQKRRTRATIAKEKGLDRLLKEIMCHSDIKDLESVAMSYISEDVVSAKDALQGAMDILAEQLSDEGRYREWARRYLMKSASITTQKKKDAEDEQKTYEMYYEFQETIKTLPSHRILAINRAEKEGVITISFTYDSTPLETYLYRGLTYKKDAISQDVKLFFEDAIKDSLTRLLMPAVERDIRRMLTEEAEAQAIEIFGQNLRQLLLQAPLKDQVIMGYDPAYRTGCKLAIIDQTGRVLAIDVIYPTPSPKQDIPKAAKKFQSLVEKYHVTMVAIGNGTASRESEQFVSEQIKAMGRKDLYYTMVSEAGASVYSASDLAREEFPDLQVEQRSAVSIARRIQDPLAELVKIDPKSVGVGQYQHDVSQKELNAQLDFVVETAVNQVGVDLNTASAALLRHISGLTKTTARNIINYREENGAFRSRMELKNVPRLGPKAFEQSVGFLRLPDGDNILDRTEIHPESYKAAEALLQALDLQKEDLGTEEGDAVIAKADAHYLAEQIGVGIETTQDILQSLQKPGRDRRDNMPAPILRQDVLTMDDLQPGMQLKGTVRNVVDFGAFIDIGVKQDGLVHISNMSERYIKHPSEVVAVGDIVDVYVKEVDLHKKRVALSMTPLEKVHD